MIVIVQCERLNKMRAMRRKCFRAIVEGSPWNDFLISFLFDDCLLDFFPFDFVLVSEETIEKKTITNEW